MFGIETKPFGVIMGMLGNVMVAIGINRALGLDVDSLDLSGFWLLPVGLTISTIAIFFGGGGAVFLGSFLAVGIGAMTANDGFAGSFGTMFGGMFVGISVLMAIAYWGLWGRHKSRTEATKDVIATGARGTGTVVSITDTGMTINDNPRVQLVMRIQPEDGSPAFDATKAVTVSRIAIPRQGDQYPVWYDRANPTQWAYGSPMTSPAASPALL